MNLKLNLLILPLLSSAAFAVPTSLPPGVIDLSSVIGIEGPTLTAPSSPLTPSPLAPIAEPPCTEIQPTRFAKADVEMTKMFVTKNGDRYEFKDEVVCRFDKPIAVFDIPKPERNSCYYIRSSELACEVNESGKKRKIAVNAFIALGHTAFFDDDQATPQKAFYATFYTGSGDGEKEALQPPSNSSFMTSDTSFAEGKFSLVPSVMTCKTDAAGNRSCEYRPISYGAKLRMEDRP